MAEELKACPCGAPAEKEPYAITPSADLFRLDCTRAECGWCVVSPTAEQAFIDWNTRAQLPSQGGEAVEIVAFLMRSDLFGSYVGLRRDSDCQGYIDPLMTVAQHQRIFAAQRIKTCIALKERNDAMALKAAPQPDAELVELIGQLVSLAAIKDEDTARSIAERIDAKLATLSAKNEGGKA